MRRYILKLTFSSKLFQRGIKIHRSASSLSHRHVVILMGRCIFLSSEMDTATKMVYTICCRQVVGVKLDFAFDFISPLIDINVTTIYDCLCKRMSFYPRSIFFSTILRILKNYNIVTKKANLMPFLNIRPTFFLIGGSSWFVESVCLLQEKFFLST